MTRRRRVIYEDDAEKPHPTASFTWGHLVNLGGIPMLSIAGMLVAQWAVSGDTLKRHDETLKQVIASREDDKRSREGMREQFMASQGKLIEVLGKLDTRLSVSEKAQETVGKQVDKITDILQRPPQAPARR